jgi:hypothetical protein
MWRETNIDGVFISPLVAYMIAALVVYVPLRWLLLHLRLQRWVWNPLLAEAGIYVCILGLLVGLL